MSILQHSRFALLGAILLLPLAVASAPSNSRLTLDPQTTAAVAESAPVFITDASVSFQVGVQGVFAIQANGVPTPTISISNGFLPAGLVFEGGQDGSATIRGTPEAGTSGSGIVQLTAVNSVASTSQNLSIFIGQSAILEGPLFAEFTVGQFATHKVRAEGDLPMSVTISGALPAGLTAADQGDGTAIISGIPAANSGGSYALTVTASNALGSDSETLTLEVSAAIPVPGERNHSGMYYAPNNPGYAVNITHQGNTLVAAWYTYNQDGRSSWFLATATRRPDGTYTGTYREHTGIPFYQINNAQAFATTRVAGKVSMAFDNTGNLDFRFLITDQTVEQSRQLSQFVFSANPPVCEFTNQSRVGANNYSDLWWQPSESGWGLTITHQDNQIFAAWYTYLDDGKSIWMVALLDRQADGSFRGPLNRAASGLYYEFEGAGAVTNFPVPEVGNASLRFVDGENAVFLYSVGAYTQAKAIERFVFSTPTQVCTSAGR